MKILRKILGITVMLAGILGLLLSLAGLSATWYYRSSMENALNNVLVTLSGTLAVSQEGLLVTEDALSAAIGSIDALQQTIEATAASLGSTQPLLQGITDFMGEQLPATLEAARFSLDAAQTGAQVVDNAIQSLKTFQSVISAIPIISAFMPAPPAQTKTGDGKPLSEALGDVSQSLAGLPELSASLSTDLNSAAGSLTDVQDGLTLMAENIGGITQSLSGYLTMVQRSQSSMQNLQAQLELWQTNLPTFVNALALVASLFLLWLLIAQIVIFTQGLELYRGTATRFEAATQPSEIANQQSEVKEQSLQPEITDQRLRSESPAQQPESDDQRLGSEITDAPEPPDQQT